MNDAGEWLGGQCGDRITRYLARDAGYTWKQRFVPNFSGPAWRIEIRQYFCGQSAAPPPAASAAPGSTPLRTTPASINKTELSICRNGELLARKSKEQE